MSRRGRREGDRDALHLARNNYDRLGHLMQGFVPALIVREWLIRCSALSAGKILNVLVVASCLAISALYELFEGLVSFVVGLTTGDQVDAFLGTQGDVWDTQWDMTCALIGATLAVLLLSRRQDRVIEKFLNCAESA
jgi:putative membrane protein